MPWKASSVMEERLRFVARLLDGEAMTDVCRDFGVSRKTGYKMFDRYKEHGLEALSDRSRRPVRYANQLPEQLESLIVRLKGEKPHWGARGIEGRPSLAYSFPRLRVTAQVAVCILLTDHMCL
jgi:transposase